MAYPSKAELTSWLINPRSISSRMTPPALEVSHLHKSYGRGKKRVEVLRDLNMIIPRGNIYGLLGEALRIYI